MAGKGDKPRPIFCELDEWYLRNELWQRKTTEKRKKEIEQILEDIKNGKIKRD